MVGVKHKHIKGISTGKLKPLRPVIESWFEVMEQYCKREKWEYNPWWYGERATLSLLAGGAWKVKTGRWIAIEEYATEKRNLAPDNENKFDKKKSSEIYGRCDLYLSNGNNDFAVEAKQAWQPIGKNGDKWGCVRKKMQSAWNDAGRLHPSEGGLRVAATFIVPRISKGKLCEATELIEEWISQGGWKKGKGWNKQHSVVAWYFPISAREKMISSHGELFPGVVMILNLRQKGTRRVGKTRTK